MKIIENVIAEFCRDFVRHPYYCYTEHGIHAAFYANLATALPNKYAVWNDQRVGLVQKEYPTATALGKPRRQHWDIAVLANPLRPVKSRPAGAPEYDYLHLDAAIEFSLNEGENHLTDDLQRLEQAEYVANPYIVQLYRLSPAGARFSGRDRSPDSSHIVPLESVVRLSKKYRATVFYARADAADSTSNGIWRIAASRTSTIS
jgi:hypothetical protein